MDAVTAVGEVVQGEFVATGEGNGEGLVAGRGTRGIKAELVQRQAVGTLPKARGEPFSAGELDGAGVFASAVEEAVAALGVDDGVLAVATGEVVGVIACTAEQGVVAGAAGDLVGTGIALTVIVPSTTVGTLAVAFIPSLITL